MIINVVIGVLEYNDHLLLVRRKKGNFPGLWGLVGGKVEEFEHIDQAVEREFKEETEFDIKYEELLGISTEIVEDFENKSSTIIYCCHVVLKDQDSSLINLENSWFSKNEKLELRWFTKRELLDDKNIIGSDLMFLNHFYYSKDKNYLKVNCNKGEDDKYVWKVI